MIKHLIIYIVILFINFDIGFSKGDDFLKNRTAIFKEWRLDTLSKLKSIFYDSTSLSKKSFLLFPNKEFKLREGDLYYGCEKLEVSYNDIDSEYLKLTYYYSGEILKDGVDKEKGLIKSLLDEIREADSLPSNGFSVSFEVRIYFFPSQIEEWKYDYVHEIKNLKISVPGELIIEYDELRGSIREKRTYKLIESK